MERKFDPRNWKIHPLYFFGMQFCSFEIFALFLLPWVFKTQRLKHGSDRTKDLKKSGFFNGRFHLHSSQLIFWPKIVLIQRDILKKAKLCAARFWENHESPAKVIKKLDKKCKVNYENLSPHKLYHSYRKDCFFWTILNRNCSAIKAFFWPIQLGGDK